MKQPFLNSTTTDKFLDGQLQVIQPQKGYRAGMDAVLLAAAVSAQDNTHVLDVGTGVGTAMLCLATRVKKCRIDGIEIQENLVDLAHKNLALNNLNGRLKVHLGDITQPAISQKKGVIGQAFYDHVMSNPPYFDYDSVTHCADASKNIAHTARYNLLKDWIEYCIDKLKFGGTLTIIFTASRMDVLIALLIGRLGQIIIFPLWSKIGHSAKRFIVQGVKSHTKQGDQQNTADFVSQLPVTQSSPCRLSYGLVMHNTDGTFTQQANHILRQGHRLDMGEG